MSTPALGHRPSRETQQHSFSLMASKKPSSTQNTTLLTLGPGHGRDQAVPGPADSLEGRQGGDVPGKHFPRSLRQIVKVHNN